MTDTLYENKNFHLKLHDSHIPWIIIYANTPYKELSALPKELKLEMFELLDIVEKELIAFYSPTKINIASFGNYLPQVHLHIMARFEEDGYFPEPMWGEQQEEINLNLPPIEEFITLLVDKLKSRPQESVTFVPVKKSTT